MSWEYLAAANCGVSTYGGLANDLAGLDGDDIAELLPFGETPDVSHSQHQKSRERPRERRFSGLRET